MLPLPFLQHCCCPPVNRPMTLPVQLAVSSKPVTLTPSDELAGQHSMIERVEEGHFDGQQWVFERVWNGDQTDWGLNFTSRPHVLKVRMATYSR